MFKFAKDRIVRWPVVVRVPTDGGTIKKQICQVDFLLLDDDGLKEMATSRTEDDALHKLAEHIRGWDESVADETGAPIAFSEQMRDALLKDPLFAKACALALMQASMGAPAKN